MKKSREERLAEKEQNMCNPFVEQICHDLREQEIPVNESLQSMAYFYTRNIAEAIDCTGGDYSIFFNNIKNSESREAFYRHAMQDALNNGGLYNDKVYYTCLIKDIFSGEIPWEKIKEGGIVLDIFKEIATTRKNFGKEESKEQAKNYGLPENRISGISLRNIENGTIVRGMKCDSINLDNQIEPQHLEQFHQILRNNLDIILEHMAPQVLNQNEAKGLPEAMSKANAQKPWAARVGGSKHSDRRVLFDNNTVLHH